MISNIFKDFWFPVLKSISGKKQFPIPQAAVGTLTSAKVGLEIAPPWDPHKKPFTKKVNS